MLESEPYRVVLIQCTAWPRVLANLAIVDCCLATPAVASAMTPTVSACLMMPANEDPVMDPAMALSQPSSCKLV